VTRDIERHEHPDFDMTPQPTARTDAAPTDEMDVARRIAAGDRAAFEWLMRHHNRRLYRLARSTMRDDAEAEDALQDAYLSAYRSIRNFRGDASLATWLSRLVLNECLGRLRTSARRQNVIPMVTSEDMDATPADERDFPDRALVRTQMRALIERKLDELPEDFRLVFVLRAVEELSVEEAAAVLGIPEATVRSRHFRARSLLREALAREIDVAERDLFDFGGAHCDRIVAAVNARLDDDSSPA
jgi:RNA polymerase sigma factor (sigma-70 family)